MIRAFRAGSQWYKDPSFYKHFGGLDSMIDPIDYRTYRAHLSSLYSARSVESLVPRILTEIQMAANRIQTSIGTNQAVNMMRTLRTISVSKITLLG
jgi:hypothetical protein